MPAALALSLCLAALALLAERLARSASAAGFTTIDTRRARLEAPEWAPPGWEEWIAVRVAERGALSSLDPEGIAALADALAAMPNVLAVEKPRVLWPDGLEIELTLRRPIACIRVRGEFLCVAADGVVLPGYWSSPPDAGRGFLPVIGPNDGALDELVPGDALVEERHLDALSVALSMRRHLRPGERVALGPVLIDAAAARAASASEAGTRLYLEDRRIALHGRAPRAGMPGELPEEIKWAHLARALAMLRDDPPFDWDLVDLRWDRARIRARSEAE